MRTSHLASILDSAPTFFGSTYAEARSLFQSACKALDIPVAEYPHPLKGPQGESLAVDVALCGPADASNLIIVNSGTHGVEGLAGSGCQVAWLRLHHRVDVPADTAVLLLHILNPWGCAWGRRQTEDNVDLNRNFLDFGQVLPTNPLYEAVHGIVVNPQHVLRAAEDPSLTRFRRENGDRALADALFSGQYQHSDGVGFGGFKASWSNRTLRSIVNTYAMSAERVVLLDVHTGLGPFGYGTLLSTERPGSPKLRRARSLFGPGIVSVSEDPSVPYDLHGSLLSWVSDHLKADVTSVGIEFGTSGLESLLELQVDDCRLRNFHDSWASLGREIRAELARFFFPGTSDWLQSVILRTLQMTHLAIRGMQRKGD
jgi:Protein of unknown function (DUF2817)